MKLFPTHQQTIHTSLSPEEVVARLSAHTLPKMPMSPFFCKRNGFWGTVSSHKFTISLIGEGTRNSFTPRIHGIMKADEAGTNLHLTMALYSPVLFFMRFYLSACFAFFLIGILISLFHHQFHWEFFLVPMIMAIGGLKLSHFGFQLGCRDSLSSLMNILK